MPLAAIPSPQRAASQIYLAIPFVGADLEKGK